MIARVFLHLVDPDAPRKLMARETTDSSGMALRKARALREVYAGLDPRKETIVYQIIRLRHQFPIIHSDTIFL